VNEKQGKIIIRDTPSQAAAAAADLFAGTARDCVSDKGFFTVAVSGGSTPGPMHRMLAKEPYRWGVPWNKTHIFWVDERRVPENDPQSNYGAAKQDILDRVDIPREQIYPVFDGDSPGEWALKYQKKIIDFFQLKEGQYPIFDLIFLGLGTDGHTASLFPGQRALEERENFVVAVKGGDPYVNRLTMTLPVLNRARQIVFLVSGKEKAEILRTVLGDNQARLPAQKIHALGGELTWILDKEAASLLPARADLKNLMHSWSSP